MPWPFTGSVAPTYNSGITTVPTTSTALPGTPGAIWVVEATFTNTTAAAITVTLTDTAGNHLISAMEVYPGSQPVGSPWTFRPVTGLKWFASTSGLKGQVWGYLQ